MLVIPKLSYESNRKAAVHAMQPRENNNIQPDQPLLAGKMDHVRDQGYTSMHSHNTGRNSFRSGSLAPPVANRSALGGFHERTHSEFAGYTPSGKTNPLKDPIGGILTKAAVYGMQVDGESGQLRLPNLSTLE